MLPYKATLLLLLLLLLRAGGTFGQLSFAQPQYTSSVPETHSPPLDVLTVQCTDGQGNSSGIEYSIPTNLPFSIGANSGVIALASPLDYETTTQYDFQAICSDQTSSTSVLVMVDVSPVNEERPEPVGLRAMFVAINESTEPGTVLASTEPGGLFQYGVTDSDTGPGNAIYYATDDIPAQYSENFIFDESVGAIIFNSSIDLDIVGSDPIIFLAFQIQVCDQQPPVSDCPNFEVSIAYSRDNDETPVITPEDLTATAPEDSLINATLTEFYCTDGDIGPGSITTVDFYILSPPNTSNDTFRLQTIGNLSTLFLADPLDREAVDRYIVAVRCSDGESGMARTSTAQLTITVTDLNDNEPTCEELSEIDLDSRIYTDFLVTTLNCSDRDIGANGALIYSVYANTLPSLSNGQLSINQDTGELTFNGRFPNRRAQYAILVEVSDRGSPPLSTTVAVVLQVTPTGVDLCVIVAPIVLILVFLWALGLGIGFCCCYRKRDGKHFMNGRVVVAEERPPVASTNEGFESTVI